MSDTQENLHPTTYRVFDFIVNYKRASCGDSPTRREIAAGVGLASVSTVNLHLENLVAAGLVDVSVRRPRCIRVENSAWIYGVE